MLYANCGMPNRYGRNDPRGTRDMRARGHFSSVTTTA